MHTDLDYYDNPQRVLRSLPPAVAELLRLDEVVPLADCEKVASNRFALVVRAQDGDTPKFLCNNRTTTLLSCAAFQQSKSSIPDVMRKVAAFHLSQAGELYGVPPDLLPECGERYESNLVVGTLPQAPPVLSESRVEKVARLRAHFEDTWGTMVPSERRAAAVKLAAASSAVLLPLTGPARDYAGGTRPPADIRKAVMLRQQFTGGDVELAASVEKIAGMVADMPGESAAAALQRLDEHLGITGLWDTSYIDDPYAAVFGAHDETEKVASLLDNVTAHEERLRAAFSPKLVDGLLRDPDVVVASLPAPERELFDSIVGG